MNNIYFKTRPKWIYENKLNTETRMQTKKKTVNIKSIRTSDEIIRSFYSLSDNSLCSDVLAHSSHTIF